MSLKICIPAIAAFLLATCGGDGNKAGDPDPSAEADFVVDTFGDLSICNNKREGATAYVKGEEKDYICTNGGWTIDTNADTRKKSSSSSAGKKTAWEYLNPNIDYGEMVDGRDGQTYKTVKIGDQVWMAENLNYKVDSSWCGGGLDTTEGDCTKYGRLYLWSTAVGKSEDECGYRRICSLPDTVYGICPPGWHLPDTTEWNKLFTAVGGISEVGKILKSQTGWNDYNGTSGNGTDAYGFSALPAGIRGDYGHFDLEGYVAYFWSATEYSSISAYSMNYVSEYALLDDYYKGGALPVRCLKDEAISSSSSATSYSSSSVTLATPCKTETEDNCEYGELLDTRDGQAYKTIKIGDQVWMAENLNFETENSWCGGGLDTTEGDCFKYGRLYTWAAAIDSAKLYKDKALDCGYGKTCSLPDTVYGICPPGWHLPDTTEWKTLLDAVGGRDFAGKILKSQTGWNDYNGTSGNGTDAYGFSALSAGLGDSTGYFYTVNECASFWSATENDSNYAYNVGLFYNYGIASLYYNIKYGALSVRCLKDDP